MQPPPTADAPMAGYRILDLTTFLSGPLASRSLAMLGADVVKVESPAGDPTRAGMGMRPGDAPSPFWLALHRDRRSVVLDLKADAGRGVLLDLVGAADALVENFRPGVMDRLGLGPEVLHERNPKMVSCSITGFGSDGPLDRLAAIDGPIQAFAGVLELTGHDGEPGLPVPMQIADIAGASYAAQAVLAALSARDRSGRGSHIEVSLVECLLQWLGVVDRAGTLAPPSTLVLECAEGAAVLVQAIMHFHPRLAALVAAVPGCEGFDVDPRFADREGRARHRDDYEATVRRAFRARSREEWLADLHQAGVPAAPVHRMDEALAHPQVVERRSAVSVEIPVLGPVPVVAPPFRFDGARRTSTTPPPALGEHTVPVLDEWLGYSAHDIDAVSGAGAFGPTALA